MLDQPKTHTARQSAVPLEGSPCQPDSGSSGWWWWWWRRRHVTSSRGLLSLPRVHAAEAPEPRRMVLPQHLEKAELPETGWERLRDLLRREDTQPYSEEVTNVLKSALAAAILGMVYGGVPAARHARLRFIQQSHGEVFHSRVDAIRSAHNAAIRGFVRYGWRWSWRVAAFVTLFNTVSTAVSVYRDEYAISHYAAAGAITGGLFRLNLGLQGLVAGSVIGSMLGVPAGALIMAMQKLMGETIRERRRRIHREQYQLKLEEWDARLHVTEDLIGQMNSSGEDHNSNLQRIQELLSLPRNEGVAEHSDNQ